MVEQSGLYNFQGCKIPFKSNFNCDKLENYLHNYHDKQVVEFLHYGWLIGYKGMVDSCDDIHITKHGTALNLKEQVSKYINLEVREGLLLGPFNKNPLQGPIKLALLVLLNRKTV